MALSLAEKSSVLALVLAVLLIPLHPLLAVLPLLVFVALCLLAPFFPSVGFYLPVISRGSATNGQVALTFDDGPSPASTPILLDLLDRHGLEATFFVVAEKAARHPDLIQSILSRGHSLGNHSLRHDYLLMLRSLDGLQADIHRGQEILARFGVRPHVFRPPAGATGPRLKPVLAREGLQAVTFSCRAIDRGNRNVRRLAARILWRLRAGDIIMLHDLAPRQRHLPEGYWERELDRLFAALVRRYRVVPLAQLIGRPVMTRLPGGPAALGPGGSGTRSQS
jgi:peptidoglycan-N-acetylglucosamine deacetylase